MPDTVRENDRGWFWSALALIVTVRVVAVAAYPATGFPDRLGYLAYADIIRSGTDWLFTAAQTSPLPEILFRAPGYPLILATIQTVFGDSGFAAAIQALQCAAMAAACIPLFGAIRRLTNAPVAAASVIGFGTSVTLAYELSLLPDAWSIAAWLALLSVCLIHWLDRSRMTLGRALALGALGIYIVMARGNGLHLLLLTAPIAALAALQPGAPHRTRAAMLAAIFLPGLICYSAVSQWNAFRTGERFFTTGAQIALVQPVFRMAKLGATPFEGDDVLARAVRLHAPDLRYDQIYDVNRALFVDHGMTPKQIADANVQLYLNTVATFPGAFARMWLRNFDDKLAVGLINPAFGLNEAHRLVLGERVFAGFSAIVKRSDGGIPAYFYALLYAVGMAVSLPLFVAAVLGAPVRALVALRRGITRADLAVAALWLTSIAVVAYYCALFVELRYVVMVSPFMAAIGAWTLRRRRRAGEGSQADHGT